MADAVGLGLPMLAPDWEFFHETMGEAALYYDGSEPALTQLFQTITPQQLKAGQTASAQLQAMYAWPRLAKKTLALFAELGCALR